jgi:NAD(P)-dependent dehydrogenase (short-subunit alcohol dehydrogenase family)
VIYSTLNGRESHKSIAIQTDVTRKDQVDGAFGQVVKEFHRLDICINNAGVCIQDPAEDMTEKDWDRIIDINLKGVFLCSQAAARVMIPQRSGSIINIASMAIHNSGGYLEKFGIEEPRLVEKPSVPP